MSSTVAVRSPRGVRGIGLFAIIAGIVMIVAGILTWILVAIQLANEEITVSNDATFMGGIFQGKQVIGPLTAYAQADIINQHALAATDGQTFAQLAQDDPRRDVVMTASFLRASLFTSIVSFGVCVLVVALGVLFWLIGSALRRLADVVPGGALAGAATPGLTSEADAYGRHASPPTGTAAAAAPPGTGYPAAPETGYAAPPDTGYAGGPAAAEPTDPLPDTTYAAPPQTGETTSGTSYATPAETGEVTGENDDSGPGRPA
ncbi:hypothetical protein [Xylanimonas sp. McL0601]|uniref:hypothetical protein n=1 Tax=Xylanimonas sp. McL0601 TaxID=3414739 RepID=UPI003CF28555